MSGVLVPCSSRLLLVDDNRTMRVLVREITRALGFSNCREASDARAAMDALVLFRPTLVITDMVLGGEDGLTLARRIRRSEDRAIARVPIIMMSGHSELVHVQAAVHAGVNTFLAKPISARALAEHVHYALNDQRPFISGPDYFGPEPRSAPGLLEPSANVHDTWASQAT